MAGTSKKAVRRTSHTRAVSAQAIRSPRQLLRHTVATLAYRAEKVLREPPAGFPGFRASAGSRTPLEILSHLGDLLAWAERLARGEYRWQPQPVDDWEAAARRFFRHLRALDRALASPPATLLWRGHDLPGTDCGRADARRSALVAAWHVRRAGAPGGLRARGDSYRPRRTGPTREACRVRRRRQPSAAEVIGGANGTGANGGARGNARSGNGLGELAPASRSPPSAEDEDWGPPAPLRRTAFALIESEGWCGREDLNLHYLAVTSS